MSAISLVLVVGLRVAPCREQIQYIFGILTFYIFYNIFFPGRKSEFKGSVKILCQPSNAPALTQLKSLSLYDCEISDLTGIGLCENLVYLNVGRNPITELPVDDFAKLASLKIVCLDDCQLKGSLSRAITDLGSSLQELRLSNNQISDVTEQISNLSSLEILGLDGNRLTSLPDALTDLLNLRILLLRGNQLTELPDLRGLISLNLLHVSSNQLEGDALLEAQLPECGSLTHVYANSNRLTVLPEGLETLPDLQHLNVAHNALEHLSDALLQKWGEPDEDGILGGGKCRVVLTANPVLSTMKQLALGAHADAADVVMDSIEN